MRRNDHDVTDSSHDYATRHFHGTNLYLDEMEKNVRYAERVAHAPDVETALRRHPPYTLAPEAVPYPKDLVGF